MPSIQRRAKRQRREWTPAHVLQLAAGYNYARSDWPDARDKDWPTAEVLEEMRQAFDDIRDDVLRESHETCLTWAELVFDFCVDPRDALYRSQATRDVRARGSEPCQA